MYNFTLLFYILWLFYVYKLKRKVLTLKKEDFGDSIVNKVYEHRVLKRMSQKELADAVGVSKQTIFVMEKNNYSPSLVLAYRIANYFEVDINEIFSYVRKGDE